MTQVARFLSNLILFANPERRSQQTSNGAILERFRFGFAIEVEVGYDFESKFNFEFEFESLIYYESEPEITLQIEYIFPTFRV